MSLTKLVEDLEAVHTYDGLADPAKAIVDWIRNYANEKNKEFLANRESGKITFGKYKGQTIEQVAKLDKGLDYLGWILRQTWFNSDKFPALYAQIKEVLKKI